jgi:hypothetical protein
LQSGLGRKQSGLEVVGLRAVGSLARKEKCLASCAREESWAEVDCG